MGFMRWVLGIAANRFYQIETEADGESKIVFVLASRFASLRWVPARWERAR